MPLALQDAERVAIKAALQFANLKQIDDAQVHRCFRDVIDFRDILPTDLVQKNGVMVERPAVGSLADYQAWQGALRDWFSRISQSERGRRSVATEVAPVVEESVSASLCFDKRRLNVEYSFRSVRAVLAFASALILDERRGMTSRLQQCGWSKCGCFNLDIDAKGRPRRFCSREHKRLADLETVSERVRKHRREQL